jgi:hypothetical protein
MQTRSRTVEMPSGPEFAVGLRYEHSSDWLRPVGLLPERKRQFSQPPLHPMRFDVRKVLAVHARCALVGAALGIDQCPLALGATSLAPRAGERHIVLTNNTSQPIIEIYVADDGTNNWQEDGLGSELLLPGNSVSVDIDDQNANCRVDIKIVLDNGLSLVHRGVNACRAEGSVVSIR